MLNGCDSAGSTLTTGTDGYGFQCIPEPPALNPVPVTADTLLNEMLNRGPTSTQLDRKEECRGIFFGVSRIVILQTLSLKTNDLLVPHGCFVGGHRDTLLPCFMH